MTPLVRKAAEYGARFTGIEPGDVFTPTRRAPIAQARHAAWAYMYSLKRPCGKPRVSLKTIGRVTALAAGQVTPFDHTSVMYGIRQFSKREPRSYALLHGGQA